MKNKKIITVLAAFLILAVGVGVGAYAASNFGSQSDPLVAKSYLDQTLTPKLQAEFQAKLDEQIRQLEQQIESTTAAAAGNFQVVTVASGKTLKGNVGCEIILRSGSAKAAGSAGLSDVTAGTALANGGALSANHLYMVAGDNEGITASGSVTVLVRGTYKIA